MNEEQDSRSPSREPREPGVSGLKPRRVTTKAGEQETWIIQFDDQAMPNEVFTGEGARQAAGKRFNALSDNWTVTLFRSVPVVTQACECPARKALELLLQNLELSDLPGYIYDSAVADCVECGRSAADILSINHEEGCLMATVEQARAALSTPCPCEGLRQEAGLFREVVKRLRGAFIVAHLGEWTEWQAAIDQFLKALRVQEHLARLASDKHDRIIELERDLCEARSGEGVYRQRAEVAEAERDRLRAENDRLRAEFQEREEEEASVCPEDIGAVEYIQAQDATIHHLRAELAASQERERVLREALNSQPSRCKCLTHGFGCGIEEATCRKDESYVCSRCSALATPEGAK